MTYILFDIGGTNMRVARSDGSEIGRILKEPTPQDPEAASLQFVSMAKEVSNGEPIEAVAGGLAGIVAPDGFVHFSPNLPQWMGYNFGSVLREHLSGQVLVRNDADLAGLGEAVYGAGRNFNIVVYLGIGTGVGGGRIVGGSIDVHAFGFEPGHQILDINTGATLEQLVGGRAVEARYGKPPRDLPNSVWKELAPTLAAGIHNTIVHWSPDCVILGGSMMTEGRGFTVEDVREVLTPVLDAFPTLPELCRWELGDDVALWGALALVRSAD